MSSSLAASTFTPRSFRQHATNTTTATTSGRATAAGRGTSLVTRADGGGGIGSTSGIPYLIARKAGFDTSEGIAGFTPFAELFIGRTAMGGFATGLAQEILTGDGILAQLGWRDTPNEEMFAVMMAFLAGTTVAGCVVTYRQMTSGEMSPSQFKRYRSFLGLSGADEAERAAAEAERDAEGSGGELLAKEFAAVSAAASAGPLESMDLDPTTATMTAKEVEDNSMVYLKTVELNNARWAMVGFATAVVMEARTGGGIFEQLIMYGKMSGLLGVDSGF